MSFCLSVCGARIEFDLKCSLCHSSCTPFKFFTFSRSYFKTKSTNRNSCALVLMILLELELWTEGKSSQYSLLIAEILSLYTSYVLGGLAVSTFIAAVGIYLSRVNYRRRASQRTKNNGKIVAIMYFLFIDLFVSIFEINVNYLSQDCLELIMIMFFFFFFFFV